MALLHREVKGDTTYEVRTAGHSHRLYTNGAFHTQYNPNHLFTGAVWDLLSLPSLGMRHAPNTVLVLGVAGGTVIHQLQVLHNPSAITGIELDPVHIRLARKYFSLKYSNLELVQAEARSWLEHSTDKFDYIVDDIFLHGEDDPARPFVANRKWFRLLASHLTDGGMLVQNQIDLAHARKSAKHLKKRPALACQTAKYENVVLAWPGNGSAKQSKQLMRQRLDAMPRKVTSRLRQQCRIFSR